jgi:hypothetical protein
MKPLGTPRDAIKPNGFFVEAIVNSATGFYVVTSIPFDGISRPTNLAAGAFSRANKVRPLPAAVRI